MEKKNTGLKVLVGILVVAVLALGGFAVYDKVLNHKEETGNKSTTKKTEDTSKYQQQVDNYISESVILDTIKPINAYVDDSYEISDSASYELNGKKIVFDIYSKEDLEEYEECVSIYGEDYCVKEDIYMILVNDKTYEVSSKYQNVVRNNSRKLFNKLNFSLNNNTKGIFNNAQIIKDNNGKEYLLIEIDDPNGGYSEIELVLFDENGNIVMYYNTGSRYYDKNDDIVNFEMNSKSFEFVINTFDSCDEGAIKVNMRITDGKPIFTYDEYIKGGSWGGKC